MTADSTASPVDAPIGAPVDDSAARRRFRAPWWLLLLVAVSLFAPPATWTAEDGWRRGDTFSSTLDAWLGFPTAVSLVHEGNADLDEFGEAVEHYSLVPTEDGRLVDDFPWTGSLVLVPVVLAVDALEVVGVGDGASAIVEQRGWGPIQVVVAALFVLWAVELAWRICGRLGIGRSRSAWLVAAWSLGSMVWSVAGRGLWQHTLLLVPLLLVAGRLLDVRLDATRLAQVGALAGVCVLIRPAVVPMLGVVGLHVLLRTKGRSWPAALAFAAVMGVGVAATLVLYDGRLPPYLDQSGRLGVHDESFVALGSLFVSASRNAFLFAPVLVLVLVGIPALVAPVFGARARASVRGAGSWPAAAAIAGSVQLVVSTALWNGWTGGFSYGPRFVVDALPLLLVPAAVAVRDVASAGRILPYLAVVGVVVNLPGAVTHQAGCWNLVEAESQREHVHDWAAFQPAWAYREWIEHGSEALLGPCDGGGAERPSGGVAVTDGQ